MPTLRHQAGERMAKVLEIEPVVLRPLRPGRLEGDGREGIGLIRGQTRGVASGPQAKHESFDEAVRCKPIGAVQAAGTDFAGSPQSGE